MFIKFERISFDILHLRNCYKDLNRIILDCFCFWNSKEDIESIGINPRIFYSYRSRLWNIRFCICIGNYQWRGS